MPVIDAQIHEIGPWSDWTGEGEETQHRIITEVATAYLDAVAVDGAILFPGGDDASAAWAAEAEPQRFAFVPPISPETPDFEAVIAAAKGRTGLVGLRVLIGWPLDGTEVRRLEAGVWDPVLAACEKYQVPVFLFITGWLPQAASVAEKFPNLTLIIDHLGLRQPPLDQAEVPPFRSLPDLLALAKFPKVYVKLCGLPALSAERYPYADVAPQLRAICDAFGADRLMWASDTSRFAGRIGIGRYQNPYTVGNYPGKHSYADSFHFIRDSEVLTESEKEEILGGTVRRALNWPTNG
jgi:predicted TIM-barrel fold metal-dependent hydrolase